MESFSHAAIVPPAKRVGCQCEEGLGRPPTFPSRDGGESAGTDRPTWTLSPSLPIRPHPFTLFLPLNNGEASSAALAIGALSDSSG
jgi:hypothetical protein